MELKNISRTGLGGCCFPDEQEKVNELLSSAIENGVNFFDQGWRYGQGENNSEKKLGAFLKDNPEAREKILICDKFPLWEDILNKFGYSETLENKEEVYNKVFERQLECLNTEYIDIYMLHALDDSEFMTEDKYIDVINWMIKLKEAGKIKHIGFSAHIDVYKLNYYLDLFEEKFGKEVEVVMLAYNVFSDSQKWLKRETGLSAWTNPGKKGFELCKKKGYTCISMMPLESGKIKEVSTDKNFIEWCFRFIKDNGYIDCTIAGTKNKEHLKEIIGYLSK